MMPLYISVRIEVHWHRSFHCDSLAFVLKRRKNHSKITMKIWEFEHSMNNFVDDMSHILAADWGFQQGHTCFSPVCL